jgi:hypothetical protein
VVQWWQRDGTMVCWWKRDGAMVKTQRYDGEKAIVRLWNNEGSMIKTWWYYGEKAMLRWCKYDDTIWWNCDCMMLKTQYFFTLSWHRIIVISPSCHRVFIIVPSYHLNFTFVPLCIAVQGDKNVTYVQTEHRNRLILNDTIS